MYAVRKGGSCLSCASDICEWALSPLGSNVAQQEACECDAGHRFSVGSVGHGNTTGGPNAREGKRSCDGRGDLRRHPGSSVVPRIPRQSRVSGPGHHQLSVIGCAIVTTSSISRHTLAFGHSRVKPMGCQGLSQNDDGTLRGSGGRWNDHLVPW